MPELTKDSRRFMDACGSLGVKCEAVEFSDTTRTSKDAAKVIGCSIGQIAKSIMSRTTSQRLVE